MRKEYMSKMIKDGETYDIFIPLYAMSDEHLVYTYNLFKDSGDRKRLDVLESELKRRCLMIFNEGMEEKELKEQGYINMVIKINE